MGDELDRLGITETEVIKRYEQGVLRQAAGILRQRVLKRRRSLLNRYLHRLGLLEFELDHAIQCLEKEAAK